ncbi:hypothetical protein M758_8G021600 [Ceratodon purpureus]|nr:hypothetical protein M758_8G021600 [Ceratodon purpureus]
MSRSRNRSSRRHTKSLSDLIDRDHGWNVDEALSSGFYKSRESLSQILPRSKDEISDLKKLEVLEQQLRSSHAETSDVKKEKEDLQKKCEVLQKDKEDLEKKNKDLLSAQADLASKAELREMLRKFKRCCPNDNVDLMKEARRKFPQVFSPDPSRGKDPTFTGEITALQNAKVNESTKLDCLRDVAMTFRSSSLPWWNAKLGEQFFILCKSVPQWNNDVFHPAMEGMERLEYSKKARKGMYSVDGVNLEPVVLELLHIKPV